MDLCADLGYQRGVAGLDVYVDGGAREGPEDALQQGHDRLGGAVASTAWLVRRKLGLGSPSPKLF